MTNLRLSKTAVDVLSGKGLSLFGKTFFAVCAVYKLDTANWTENKSLDVRVDEIEKECERAFVLTPAELCLISITKPVLLSKQYLVD